MQPESQFMLEGEYRATRSHPYAMYWKIKFVFPSLDRPDTAAKVGGNLLPGVQNRWLRRI
jgi:hypothetical protein